MGGFQIICGRAIKQVPPKVRRCMANRITPFETHCSLTCFDTMINLPLAGSHRFLRFAFPCCIPTVSFSSVVFFTFFFLP